MMTAGTALGIDADHPASLARFGEQRAAGDAIRAYDAADSIRNQRSISSR